ncbi:MAG TPA: DegT/DnrJ/EryC1/StrS family aminotransferase [Pseudobacteroides sp.]|uniref:DegT/DnrJ/EryC1/StrS family aminotransferase n=1 Tax=Pseudobacteroides sp. TaxID=1968840 RepID=UPI002F958782
MLSPRLEENKWDLPHSYGSMYGVEEAQAMLEVLNEWAPTNNKRVREYESRFSTFVGASYGVATNSWGGAAHLVAIMMDIKEGDEIIVPAMAMSATANIFVREGAKIVFAESNPRTFNIDVEKLEEKITSKTKAIIIVHMCGQPCDMDPIVDIARRHGLLLVQDAAHAPGAMYKGKGLGEFGDYVIYSFHQAKNICTLGEGGMVVTNNKEWAEKLKKLRGHGAGLYIGVSNRMTEIQAAVGLVQLDRIKTHTETRRRLSYYINEFIRDIDGLSTPYEISDVYHVYHLYNLLVDEKRLGMTKNELMRYLWKKRRIMAISYYPTVNCLPPYKELGHGEGECPITEEMAARAIALPMSPRYTEADIEEMVTGIRDVVNMRKKGLI